MAIGYVTFTLPFSTNAELTVAGDFWTDGLGDEQLIDWGDARIDYGNGEGSSLIPGSYKHYPSQASPPVAETGIWTVKLPLNVKNLGFKKLGAVNAVFGNMDNLETLDINECGITTIPDLTDCIKLKSLNLEDNDILGAFPGFTELYSLVSLNSVKLSGNQFVQPIPDLDAFPDLTEYYYTPDEVIDGIDVYNNVSENDWDFIKVRWEDLPGTGEIFDVYNNTIAPGVSIYNGDLHLFVETGLDQGTTYEYRVHSTYFGNSIEGINSFTTDACQPPAVIDLNLTNTEALCVNLKYTWLNTWKESPTRSDLTMTLELYQGITLVQGPINVVALSEYDFTGLDLDTEYKVIMNITKCGETVQYELINSTLDCSPPSEIELDLRQI